MLQILKEYVMFKSIRMHLKHSSYSCSFCFIYLAASIVFQQSATKILSEAISVNGTHFKDSLHVVC